MTCLSFLQPYTGEGNVSAVWNRVETAILNFIPTIKR